MVERGRKELSMESVKDVTEAERVAKVKTGSCLLRAGGAA